MLTAHGEAGFQLITVIGKNLAARSSGFVYTNTYEHNGKMIALQHAFELQGSVIALCCVV